MPITLQPPDAAFLERVETYCAEGLDQPAMVERERAIDPISLSGFRTKLLQLGFTIKLERRVARVPTGESLEELRAAGELMTAELEPAVAAA